MEQMAHIWTNLSPFMPMETSSLNSMEDGLSIVRVMKLVNAGYLVKL